MAYRALLFDLFGTVVLFKRLDEPRREGWRGLAPWLEEALRSELPGVDAGELAAAMAAVTDEIVRGRPPEYREVPSHERFRRTLERLGVRDEALAERLSLVHMGHLADRTEVPAEHLALLRELFARYRLGLVSNFDHGPTAREILRRHGLADLFEVTLISEEFGRRKPHPAIFESALAQMGVSASDALFVGDSLDDDVRGAQAAGIDVAWINSTGAPLPAGVAPPVHVIARLVDLRRKLGR